jgi:hypothetical protein
MFHFADKWNHENPILAKKVNDKNAICDDAKYILGVVKFSDFFVKAFRLANLSIWTENYSLQSENLPAWSI